MNVKRIVFTAVILLIPRDAAGENTTDGQSPAFDIRSAFADVGKIQNTAPSSWHVTQRKPDRGSDKTWTTA